uniref:Uncharacterized protein n=1 Tax=Anopheles darlingi TaxID=43151 RepID=A0A2M4CWR7_ANODA
MQSTLFVLAGRGCSLCISTGGRKTKTVPNVKLKPRSRRWNGCIVEHESVQHKKKGKQNRVTTLCMPKAYAA